MHVAIIEAKTVRRQEASHGGKKFRGQSSTPRGTTMDTNVNSRYMSMNMHPNTR